MANRWCDGFGRYGGNKAHMLNGSSGQAWAQIDDDWTLSSLNPRTGTHHLRLDNSLTGTGEVRRVFGAPLSAVYYGHAVHFDVLPSAEPSPDANSGDIGLCLAAFRDQANGTQVTFFLGTDGAIVAYRGGTFGAPNSTFTGTLLGRTVPIIGAGAYQHIEYFLLAGDASDGAIEVRVDEVTRLNLTNITTTGAGREFSQVAHRAEGATGPVWDIADCYANDTTADGSGCNSFIGDVKSGVLMVNADTATAGFSLSAGVSGYDLIDEKPADDATYIYSAAAAAESRFGLEDAPANLTEILTARPFMRAMKDDAGTATIAPSLYSGASKGAVAGQPVTTAFAYYDSNVPLDPATGVPWTLAGLNAAQHVVERTA